MDLGSRDGLVVGASLWAWGPRAHPPFRDPPTAQLRVERLFDDRARLAVIDARDVRLAGGWAVWTGDREGALLGTRLAVPAPPRLPDPTGWPPAASSIAQGNGGVGLAALSLLAFEPLVVETAHGLVPGAARWWSSDDGHRVWRFELQPDLAWNDGTPVTPGEVARVLGEALESNAQSLAPALLARPPRAQGNALVLTTAAAAPDLPRYLAAPELGIRSGTRGAGPYALVLEPRVTLLRRTPRGGAQRIEVIDGDPTLHFHLGETHIWRGIRAAAPVTEERLLTEAGLRHREDGELWVLLVMDPEFRALIEPFDRRSVIDTYLGTGQPETSLARLIGIPRATRSSDLEAGEATPGAQAGAAARRNVPPPHWESLDPATALDSALIVLAPEGAPAALVALGERVQALLIRAGYPAVLERGDPRRRGDARRTVTVVGYTPPSSDPLLCTWNIARDLGWTDRKRRGELATALLAVAAHPDDDARLEALAARVSEELGVVPIARVPLELWLRPEVEVPTGAVDWHQLWTQPPAPPLGLRTTPSPSLAHRHPPGE